MPRARLGPFDVVLAGVGVVCGVVCAVGGFALGLHRLRGALDALQWTDERLPLTVMLGVTGAPVWAAFAGTLLLVGAGLALQYFAARKARHKPSVAPRVLLIGAVSVAPAGWLLTEAGTHDAARVAQSVFGTPGITTCACAPDFLCVDDCLCGCDERGLRRMALIDRDNDGHPDATVRWSFDDRGRLTQVESDTNGDGRPERTCTFEPPCPQEQGASCKPRCEGDGER